jgi:inosine-uridine nucleoside N-ribohydrolase
MRKNVILDTDLGTDIDDSWALGMLLNCSELDLKLVLTATSDTVYRASVAAKHLTQFQRTDIPIGIGIPTDEPRQKETLVEWLDGYSVDEYAGPVYRDGLTRMIEIVEAETEVTIIAIAPLTNIAEFCRRRPDLVGKCNLVAMSGSIEKVSLDRLHKGEEWNVLLDIPAAKTVYGAPWKSFIITPLDHCGNLILTDDVYAAVRDSESPIAKSIIDAYRFWVKNYDYEEALPDKRSSILFDTAAVHLACRRDDSIIRTLKLKVADDAKLLEEPDGVPVECALDWTDRAAYLRHLADIIAR